MRDFDMLERVVRLETQYKAMGMTMAEVRKDLENLTVAVTRLANILEQGKGVKFLITFVIILMPIISAIIGAIAWLKSS